MDVIRLFFNWHVMWVWREEIFLGFLTTLSLTVVAFAVSVVPATIVAILRIYGPRPVKGILIALVSFIRSVPAVVLITFVFFGLPFIGIVFSSFTAVVATLAVVQIVYFSEVFRGGLLSVGKGQFDAAYACGLRTSHVYRYVVLPQAFVIAAPAFASSVILLVQNTTVASVTATRDLVGTAQDIQASTGSPAAWLPATFLYLLFLLPLARRVRRWEEQMARAREA